KQFELLAGDVGRSIGHVRHNLAFMEAEGAGDASECGASLESFIAESIAEVRERECEVRDKAGRWHSLRVRPYFTLDNKVDGAVLVLLDIDRLKQTERAAVAARDYAQSIVETVPDPLLILNGDLRVDTANEAFYGTFRVSRADVEGRLIYDLGNGQWRDPRLRRLLEDVLPRNSFFDNFEVSHDFEGLGRRTMLLNARTLADAGDGAGRILLGIQDVTELLHFQAAVRRSEIRYRRLFEAAQDGVLIIDPATRKILDANPFMTHLLGYAREELMGKELFEIGLLRDEAASRAAFGELRRNGAIRYDDLPLESKTGQRHEVEFVSNLYDEDGETIIQCNIRDVTDRTRAADALRDSREELRRNAETFANLV
ncbi:MAG TPA: PAS domain S-box protein, partial [Thermomicrobiales bacterium]|nr:PAS domain S-box protein [Thermomicrobiales bacterium]